MSIPKNLCDCNCKMTSSPTILKYISSILGSTYYYYSRLHGCIPISIQPSRGLRTELSKHQNFDIEFGTRKIPRKTLHIAAFLLNLVHCNTKNMPYTLPRKILLCSINWGTQLTMEISSNE